MTNILTLDTAGDIAIGEEVSRLVGKWTVNSLLKYVPAPYDGKRTLENCPCSECIEGRKAFLRQFMVTHSHQVNFTKTEDVIPTSVWRRVSAHCSGARTQKIRGLAAIDNVARLTGASSYDALNWYFTGARELLVASDGASIAPIAFPLFIRPCPVTPRHGFVDSRLVSNVAELFAVAQEAVNADLDAELIVCPFLSAGSYDHSAVLTPGSFSWGEGNDGATSGKSGTVFGPGLTQSYLDVLNANASIANGDAPFVELVGNGYGDMTIVQVRGGPALAASEDFVPVDVVVCSLLVATANTDLLQWEKDVAHATPGTVVYADGLSLASHFCVHAVVNNVPVITTRKPEIGEKLTATDVPVWSSSDWRRLASKITEADAVIAGDELGASWCRLGTLALHCAGFPAPATGSQTRLLAYGVVAALKHIAAASIGEARHIHHTYWRGGVPGERATRAWAVVSLLVEKETDRDVFYKHGQHASIATLRNALIGVGHIYNYRAWEGAYGGKKWAAINAGARKLADRLAFFRDKPCKASWARVVETWNAAIHLEHNGADTTFGKFGLSKGDMDMCATWPVGQVSTLRLRILKILFHGPERKALINGLKAQVDSPKPSALLAPGVASLPTHEAKALVALGDVLGVSIWDMEGLECKEAA